MNPLIQFKQINLFLVTLLLVSFGFLSGAQAVVPAPDGGYPGGNTAEGQAALLRLTTGQSNTAVGNQALRNVTTASHNTAIGAGALFRNTADENTATGYGALLNNTTGHDNTATGMLALFSNTIGEGNTATGHHALNRNTTGYYNTAIGGDALANNITGVYNTATGFSALRENNAGSHNTADGYHALYGSHGSDNTALGYYAGAALSGNNNIDIGANVNGLVGESNTIRIGNANITDTFIKGIYNQHLFVGLPVYIQPNGQLFTDASSKRFKEEIKAMDKASDALFALKPVTFRYKKAIDPVGITQFGLVAEDVEKVNPDLVVRGKEGKPDSVRYDQVNAMLLNEFLKEHRAVQEQQKQIESLKAELKEQRILIQKVSAQLEVSKPAGKTVLNNN